MLLSLACSIVALAAQVPECPDSPASETMADAVSAYGNGEYAKAADLFETAARLDTSCIMAWLYAGNSYLKQVVPGADTPENRELAEKAREHFETVVSQQPENEQARAAIAQIYFDQKKWDDAKAAYEKLVEINRYNKEAFCQLGVIAWIRSSEARLEARAKLGMKPEDPGPIKDTAVRQALRDKYWPVIDDGIQDLKHAIETEAEYDAAMSYLNLLYREKADLEDSAEEYMADIAQADDWRQQAADIRKDKDRRGRRN